MREHLTRTLKFRVTKTEGEEIEKRAAEAGFIALSEYLRVVIKQGGKIRFDANMPKEIHVESTKVEVIKKPDISEKQKNTHAG